MFFQPHQLGQGPQRRGLIVALIPQSIQILPVQQGAFLTGTAVRPVDHIADHLILVIQKHCHMGGCIQSQSHNVLAADTGFVQNGTDIVLTCLIGIFRLLLAEAVLGVVHGVLFRSGADDLAVAVDEGSLGGAAAEINSQ